MPNTLPWTGSEEANRLLAESPLALMIGMLLDQQVRMEVAFHSPYLLEERLGRPLEVGHIASMDGEELEKIFRGPPALHRFPNAMARRTQALCQALAEHYDGNPARIWETAADGPELLKRLKGLPGYGDAKARIFVGIVGKRLGEGPAGWEKVAADWPSIADIAEFDQIESLRMAKARMKADKKG
ncbi:MAG: Fe-S cluster assembly protein HesB [bacterium]|nr:Fe-S cluster assembly protein HesB [bacterium]